MTPPSLPRIGRSLTAVLTGIAAALAATVAVAPPAHAATFPVDPPVTTNKPNPGLIHTAEHNWVMLTTGSIEVGGRIHTAGELAGEWTSTGRPLLINKTLPRWMDRDPSDANPNDGNPNVWAPSIVRATTGQYVVFFAGVVGGHDTERCIGTAVGASPLGDFTPTDGPLACWAGSGTKSPDPVPFEGDGFTIIDPTPAWVDGQLVLTFKTSYHDGSNFHTTTRMLRLDPADPTSILPNPVRDNGWSVKLTDSLSGKIEENPVMVEQNGRFTLFTSYGLYGTCDYLTRYRQNTSLWTGWLTTSPTNLNFPDDMNTCGTGNAQVVQGVPAGSWRIVFNGHPDEATEGGPDGIYVGNVAWDQYGRPRVTQLF